MAVDLLRFLQLGEKSNPVLKNLVQNFKHSFYNTNRQERENYVKRENY
jgi:hypothetical protein